MVFIVKSLEFLTAGTHEKVIHVAVNQSAVEAPITFFRAADVALAVRAFGWNQMQFQIHPVRTIMVDSGLMPSCTVHDQHIARGQICLEYRQAFRQYIRIQLPCISEISQFVGAQMNANPPVF